MPSLKSIAKKCFPKKERFKINKMSRNYSLYFDKSMGKLEYFIKNYFKYKVYGKNEYHLSLIKMYKNINFELADDFIYTLDDKEIFYSIDNYSNGAIDYSLILNHSLNELKGLTDNQDIIALYDAIITIINDKFKNSDNKYARYLMKMIDTKASCLEEALQRVLFINQLFWQTGHTLMGLGRIDKYLDSYVGNLNDKEITSILIRFINILHRDYKFKSNMLFGDTGQIFILGGLEESGEYFSNRLTYLFIDALKQCNVPDPKILLRVSNQMPRNLLEKAIDCIKSGLGCPLLSNDDIIINKMIEFGYDKADAYNYVTSACWEPTPENVSADSNNALSYDYVVPFIATLKSEKINDNTTFLQLFNLYCENLKEYTINLANTAINITYGHDVLASGFNLECLKRGKTIDNLGAKYNNIGATSVGVGNVINSFIAIDYLVYKEKKYSLKQFISIVDNNYKDNDELVYYIKNELPKYGNDDEYVLNLTNKVVSVTEKYFKCDKRKLKFGLSSPSYIDGGKYLLATPDGRKNYEPLNVHISCSKPLAYTELVSFAAKLDYSKNCINGNVVDFFTNPSFMEKNLEKFTDFIDLSIKEGFYQMQINVVDSQTLIKAKNNPELYPNLIVRVWGFSAYFNDLPQEYKDVLIERAIKSEYAY